MFCKYCGAELQENDSLCTNCGKENAEKKSKTKLVITIVVAVLCGALLMAALGAMVYYGVYGRLFRNNDVQYKDNYTVSDGALQKKLDTVVATLGDAELTNGQLQVFYWMQIYNYGYYYEVDFTEPLHKQMIDEEKGLTYQQYFLDTAITSWKQYQILADMAEEANYKMPEEYQKQLDGLEATAKESAQGSGYESVEEMLAADFGVGTTLESYKNYFYLYYLGNLYFSEMVDNLEVSEAELEAYFAEHQDSLKTQWDKVVTKESGELVDVRHILIQPTGGTKDESGNTTFSDAQWEACREKAQKLYDNWKSGEATENSFSTLARLNSADSNKEDGGLYRDISKGVMVKEFEDWCFDETRKYGDHGMVKTEFGYHVMYFVGAEEGWIRLCREGVLSDKADNLLETVLTDNPAEVNFKAIVLSNIDISG